MDFTCRNMYSRDLVINNGSKRSKGGEISRSIIHMFWGFTMAIYKSVARPPPHMFWSFTIAIYKSVQRPPTCSEALPWSYIRVFSDPLTCSEALLSPSIRVFGYPSHMFRGFTMAIYKSVQRPPPPHMFWSFTIAIYKCSGPPPPMLSRGVAKEVGHLN